MQTLIPLCFIFLTWSTLTAQPSQYSFLHYTTDQGLSHDHITGITRDKRGFLWVSTINGLNRFDGSRFKVFHHDPGDPKSLPHDHIMGITLAPDGWIWVATANGLCRINPDDLNIIFIPLPENADTLKNDLVTRVAFDESGNAWTTGETGIYKIDPENGEILFFHPTPGPTFGWYGMHIDDQNHIWMIKDSMRCFDPDAGTFTTFKGTNPAESFNQSGPLSIVEDPAGDLWVGTWYYGIWKYDPGLHEFTRHPESPIFAMMLLPDTDASGNQFFWVGGGKSGLGIFDPKQKTFTEFNHDPQNPFSHNNYLGTTLYNDPANDDIWIGTDVGLEQYAPSSVRFTRAAIPQETDMNQFSLVSGIVQDNTDPNGDRYFIAVWGTGLYAWQKTGHKISRLRSPTQMTKGGNFNLMQDSKGNVWSCMKDGIGRYQPASGAWKDYLNFFRDNKRNNLFWCAKEDRQGNIWFGSNRDGLYTYNVERDQMEPAFYKESFANEEGTLCIISIAEDDSGRLWLAGVTAGLLRFDPKSGEAVQYRYDQQKIDNVCNAVTAGKNGRIYASYYSALLELDTEGRLIRLFTQANGLKSNKITSLVCDHSGKIWFNSEYLLHCFDPATGTFNYYGKSDGLISNTMTDALSITPDGEIFVGFQNAFNYFNPAKLRHNDQPPPVAITSIKVMNKERGMTRQARSNFLLNLFSSKNNKPGRDTILLLKPGEDFFEIEFAALNFNQPERNQYAYILEGFHKEWVYTDRPVATFTNLDGGQYVLRMKAANNDGIWNEKGIALAIRVNPPFQKTQWFYFLLLLGLGGIAMVMMMVRRHQRQRLTQFREALARDLHDEMGSTLSSIRFFSEYATGQIGSDKPQVTPMLHRISQSATDLSESMQDIIWAMNTRSDQLEDLATHMVESGLRIFEAKNVVFKSNVSPDFAGRHLWPEVRRNIYLIYKEAINNAAKYASATLVELHCYIHKGVLVMQLSDNGIGFDVNHSPAGRGGNGIPNMRKRTRDIGASLSIQSDPGTGTKIELRVPI